MSDIVFNDMGGDMPEVDESEIDLELEEEVRPLSLTLNPEPSPRTLTSNPHLKPRTLTSNPRKRTIS